MPFAKVGVHLLRHSLGFGELSVKKRLGHLQFAMPVTSDMPRARAVSS